MKKLIIIILLCLLSGCGLLDDGCHQCKGLSPQYEEMLLEQYEYELLSYQEMMYKMNKAINCKAEVCDGNDYCQTHRKGW